MVCGLRGSGKTSFLNTLAGRRIFGNGLTDSVESISRPSEFESRSIELDLEDGTRLTLNLIDTPGIDAIDARPRIDGLAEFIECRYDEVLAEESRIRRNPRFKDDRVHCCLYFIEPTGHGLREVDIATLSRLAPIVNILPVLSRADQLTPTERLAAKRVVMEDLQFYKIPIFDFMNSYNDMDGEYADPELSQMGRTLAESIPFAITSSTSFTTDGTPLYRCSLAHGIVDVLNPDHSNFQLLRDTLLETHLSDFKDSTRDNLYESYRTAKLDPHRDHRASILMPAELAEQSARLKEAQLRRESEQMREMSERIQREIESKKRELAAREQELRNLELQMARERENMVAPLHPIQLASDMGSVSAPVSAVDGYVDMPFGNKHKSADLNTATLAMSNYAEVEARAIAGGGSGASATAEAHAAAQAQASTLQAEMSSLQARAQSLAEGQAKKLAEAAAVAQTSSESQAHIEVLQKDIKPSSDLFEHKTSPLQIRKPNSGVFLSSTPPIPKQNASRTSH